MDSKPLSVLVTGSSGFIGSHVVRQLHTAGHRVTALDFLKPKFPLPDGVEFRQCDIREDHFPNRIFDAVVHLAALAGVRPSMTHPVGYHQTNVNGTLRLLEFCRSMGVPHFVFASSSSVYGPDSPLPFTEDGPPDPCSPYALTKLQGEQWGQIRDRGSWIVDRGSWIVDRGSWIVDRGSWIRDRGSGIVDQGSWIVDRGSRIVDR